MDKELIHAAWQGTIEDVKRLLAAGANANATDQRGMLTPWKYAAGGGRLDVMRLLIERGADVNAVSGDGTSPLIEAAGNRNPDAVNLLLKAGAKPSADALAKATMMSRDETAMVLLTAGAPPGPALSAAALRGETKILQTLIAHGADIDSQSEQGNTALHAAVQGGNVDIIRLLVKAKVDLTKRNEELVSPVRLAAMRGHVQAYELLVQACGGSETFTPVEQIHVSENTIRELIDALRSKDYSVRKQAGIDLVARGKGAVDELVAASTGH